MKTVLCVGSFLLAVSLSVGQTPLSKRVASYDMDVKLDTDRKRLNGTTELLWVNPSPDTIHELQFHLYFNAFKSNMSSWMQEGEQFVSFISPEWYEECNWGWSLIHEFEDQEANDLTRGFEFIRPEDDNPYDETVLRVPLRVPVMPNDSARFRFEWIAQIPKAMIRTGYNQDFYFFAQWFPKLGVYEPAGMRYATKGGWNCHQYHADGEYFADFGVYNVSLNVPSDFVLGASGQLVDKNVTNDLTAWTFRAEDVIDFTWTASPHFIVLEDTWKDVGISVLMYPEHERFFPRYQKSIQQVLEFMDGHIGDYPYPNLTVVDPPLHGMFVGGMEYPTLITSFSSAFLPEGFKSTEILVVHEFIHQYFMQMVATNEQEEAWMDEGITSYYEARIMDQYYGEQTSMIDWCGIQIGNMEFTRHEFFSSGHVKVAPNTRNSWEFRHGGYSAMQYNKVALWLKTMEGIVGTEVFDEAMRTYFERWKFKHPCGRDFVTVINEVVAAKLPDQFPQGMDWFFAQVLESTEVCDYSVASIVNTPTRIPIGVIGDTANCVLPPSANDPKKEGYTSKVVLHRLGEVFVPLEIRITFEDGKQIMEYWDGKDRSKDFKYSGTSKVVSAEIDPERKIILDLNYINNSMTLSDQKDGLNAVFVRYLNSVQHFLESVSLFM